MGRGAGGVRARKVTVFPAIFPAFAPEMLSRGNDPAHDSNRCLHCARGRAVDARAGVRARRLGRAEGEEGQELLRNRPSRKRRSRNTSAPRRRTKSSSTPIGMTSRPNGASASPSGATSSKSCWRIMSSPSRRSIRDRRVRPACRRRAGSRRTSSCRRSRALRISSPPRPSTTSSRLTGRRAISNSSAPMRRLRSTRGSRKSRRSASTRSRPAATAPTTCRRG